jgi:hypothetical protein
MPTMSADLETILPDLVGAELQKSGIVDSPLGLRLEPLARDPGRLDHGARRSFRVRSGPKTVCYLIAGRGIEEIWNRAQVFAQECPDIAARPLFVRSEPEVAFLGLEFIEGPTLEDAARGESDPRKLEEAAAAVLAALDRTVRPSSAAARQSELEEFFAWVQACPIFGPIDCGFLRDTVFPWIRDGAAAAIPQTRWTNGDLVAHNVVIDSRGHPRLIDYEYAVRTHFYAEDFLRWRRYSKALKNALGSALEPPPPWLEAFFLLRQTVLEQRTSHPRVALSGAEERVRRLRELAAGAHVGFEASLFLKPLTRLEPELRNLEKQMARAQTQTAQILGELEQVARKASLLDEALGREQKEHARSAAEREARAARALADEQTRRAVLQDKIGRMQNSFSWKSTAPLRAVRRLLFGK